MGALLTTAARFILYQPGAVHYHANFALYVDGKRDEFKGPGYYEEVLACAADEHNEDDPMGRAHMHNNVNDVIHVHANAVTWSHFFANLGYHLGEDVISDGRMIYTKDSNNKLTFILNGKTTDSITNKLIGNEDILLVNYGNDTDNEILNRYSKIARTASEYNNNQDPSGCSGEEELSFWQKLKIALGTNSH